MDDTELATNAVQATWVESELSDHEPPLLRRYFEAAQELETTAPEEETPVEVEP